MSALRFAEKTMQSTAHGAPLKITPFSLQLCLTAMTVLVVVLVGDQHGWDAEVRLDWLSRFALLQLILQIGILFRCFRSALAPPLVFSFLLSIFSSGWLILRAFSRQESRFDVVGRLSTDSVNAATEFYLLAYVAFGLGVVAMGARNPHSRIVKEDASSRLRETTHRQALAKVGAACIAIGVGPFLAATANNLIIVARDGYSAYYVPGNRLDNPLLALAPYFIVGLIMMGLTAVPKQAQWAVRALFAVALVRLAAGDRGEGFIYLISAVMIRQYSPNHIGRPAASPLRLGLIATVSVMLIPLIGSMRQGFGQDVATGVGGFSEENPIVGTLRTLGGTIYPLVTSIELVPSSQGYLYGGSYLSGAMRILPGPLRPPWTVDPLYASPASWLQEQQGLSYGPGFTPFAEAYVNFGFLGGCVLLFAFGLISTRLLRIRPNATLRRVVFVVVVFALCGFLVRGSFNFAVPFIVRYAMFPMLAARLVAANRLQNTRKISA